MRHPNEHVLVVDIGNSLTKIGYFKDGNLEGSESFPTERAENALLQDELRETLGQLASVQSALGGIVVSSVVPSATQLFRQVLTAAFPQSAVLWFDWEHQERFSYGAVDFSRYDGGHLGVDRMANVLAAHALYPNQKVIVCDFGTTSTFDLVDADGLFLGGAICPGARTFQSLVDPAHAAQLFEVDVFQPPRRTPGRSTEDSLANGLYYGYKGAVLEIVGNLLQSAQWPLSQTTLVFTGGDAYDVRQMLTTEIPQVHIDAGLTLKGLFTLWTFNRDQLSAVVENTR
jgi:type III pantothenate kinase